ncbi:MAG: ubiquitin family protein [Gemmatimonadota bacterium]|nr:ubiquitin family protein [Gemmatimonadota bacterium]
MTVVTELSVRVWVPEVWDIVELSVTPDWTVARLKTEALQKATGRSPQMADYEVKFRGGKLSDETRTLADLAVPDQAAFIVLATRRVPVR